MKIQVLNSYLTANTTFYAASQSLATAGSLVLNYSAVNANANIVVSTPEWNRIITFTSGGTNNSGVNAVLTGVDAFGNIVSETIPALPAASGTVFSNLYYSSLISVVTNGAVTALSVGIATPAISIPFKMSMNVSKAQWAVQTVVGGTINYDLQYTLFPFENYISPPTFDTTNNWLNVPIIAPGGNTSTGTVVAALTTSQYLNFAAPVYAIRFVINSGTTPTFEAFMAQQGTL
jgi:hypothetical protein